MTTQRVWKRQIVKLQQVTGSSHAQDRCNLCRLCRTLQLCVQSRAYEMHAPSRPFAPSRPLSPLLSSRARVAACGVATLEGKGK